MNQQTAHAVRELIWASRMAVASLPPAHPVRLSLAREITNAQNAMREDVHPFLHSIATKLQSTSLQGK